MGVLTFQQQTQSLCKYYSEIVKTIANTGEMCLSRMMSYLIIDFQMLSSTHLNIREAEVVSLVLKVSYSILMDCQELSCIGYLLPIYSKSIE